MNKAQREHEVSAALDAMIQATKRLEAAGFTAGADAIREAFWGVMEDYERQDAR